MATRVGLIVGAGAMGRAWGRTLLACPDVRAGGWVDVRPGAAAAAAAETGLAGLYLGTDLADALHTLRPDFLVDVTPPAAHYPVTLRALAAGIPVLGEKPLADSLAHARVMVRAAERSGVLFMVSQNRRYDARLQAYRRLIAEVLGPLGVLNSDFYLGAHFGGFRETMPSPLLLDMAIHTFDAARYLSGADPVAVYCEEFNPPWSWFAGPASATAVFEMTGGLRYTYRGSWTADGRPTAWESEWRAVGPHGTATWDGLGAPLAEVAMGAPEGLHAPVAPRTVAPAPDVPAGIAGSLRDFLHALDTGTPPQGECHDNIRSLAMVFAAMRSAGTRRRVPVRF